MINYKRKQVLCSALLVGGLVGASAPVYANQTLQQLIDIMRQNGSISQQQYDQLKGAMHQDTKAKKKAEERQQKQIAEIKSSAGSEPGWWKDTKISGRMYSDFSYIDNQRSGVKQDNTGPGFDVKRFYVGIDHKFNDIFSANLTTDFTTGVNSNADVFIKKAYLDVNLDPRFDLRLGSTDLPWIPFVEGIYGKRYVENVLIDRTKFGTSADWGVHAKGSFNNGFLNYAVSVIDGAGYKHPDVGVHTNTMDFEGRVNINWNHFILATGGYVGKLGKDVESVSTPHTATRFDALAAYVNDPIRLGVSYFKSWDWNSVTTATTDTADGVMAFGTYNFNAKWSVFGRYDHVSLKNNATNNNPTDNYFNVGLQYSPAKIVDFALVYKRDRATDGFLSTSNGTIGSLSALSGSGTYNEVGVWSRLRW